MAEQKEIFHVLRDPNGDGIAPDARSATESLGLSIVNVPVIGSKDSSGNGQYEEVRTEGQNADAVNWGVQLTAKDQSGNLQFMPMKNGAIIVTDDGAGTEVGQIDEGTVSSPGSAETATEITLGASNTYSNIEVCGSSFKDCFWSLVYVDDADGTPAESLICDFRTGAGSYTFRDQIKNYTLDTSGGTGTQKLRLYITQRAGTGSNFSGEIRAIEN